MKVLVQHFFKDDRGDWHQPGNIDSFDNPAEIEALVKRGAIKIIKTAMVEAPESRVLQLKGRGRR